MPLTMAFSVLPSLGSGEFTFGDEGFVVGALTNETAGLAVRGPVPPPKTDGVGKSLREIAAASAFAESGAVVVAAASSTTLVSVPPATQYVR